MPVQNVKNTNKNEAYFHIYNKGVDNRNLFNDDQDYKVFLSYLKDYLTAPPDPEKLKKTFSVKGRAFKGVPHQPKNYFNKVELIAYNLMPNHFHLLVRQNTHGSLAKLTRSISTRYAIYYNKKYKRRGSLCAGPYKSVQIKDVYQLVYLTRFLHREPLKEKHGVKDLNHNVYSSYKEYFGLRETSWIKPQVVFSYLDKIDNNYFKGTNGYKNFVEKYQLNQKEKNMLEGIIIERKPTHLESRDHKLKGNGSTKEVHVEPISEPRRKISEFIAASTMAFLLLFTVGFRNVTKSSTETTKSIASLPSPTPQVAGVGEEISEIEDLITEVEKEVEDFQETQDLGEVEDLEKVEPESKTMIIIKITDDTESVNLREKPTTESAKVGKAKDGDTFELISEESGWYQIKLDDGEVAFVSVDLAQIEEEEIN